MMGTAQDIPEIGLLPSDLPAGTMVGGYQVAEKIGQGGMGQVYSAAHPLIGKKVAIKILAPQCVAVPDLVRRFIEEARAVNKIGHPHIIDIFSFGQLPDGRHFMVMEYLEGKNLAQRLERETIPVPELRRLLVQICEALEAAHGAGIVHRDLKPENIWIVQKPQEESHIKLLDFGIAKLLGAADTGRITQTGAAMGTPQFMPPEQCLGRPVDHRADIYSFGIILYLVFTGHLPFNGSTLAEIVYRHTTEAPRPPSQHRPLPAELEKLILDCLAKEPDLRPNSAREVADRLDAVLSGPSRTSTVVLSNEVARGARGRTPGRQDGDPPRWAPPSNARSWEQLEQAVGGTTARPAARSRTAAALMLAIGIATLAAGLVLSRADRPAPAQLETLATAAETRLGEALASRGRSLEPRVAEAARVPQLVSALQIRKDATFKEWRGTVQDVLSSEDWWGPFRAPPAVSALVTGDGVASVGPGLGDVAGSDLVKRARANGIASGLLPGQDRVFMAAATLVDGNDRGPAAPLVVLGTPLDQAAFQALSERTGDAIGLVAGTRLLETAGPEQPRRLLSALAQRPVRARPLDEAGAWLGTMVPVDGKLSLLSVFAAPAPPRPLKTGLVVAALGGLLLVIGAGLLMRSRAH
jgi:serine/threonine protein kinase